MPAVWCIPLTRGFILASSATIKNYEHSHKTTNVSSLICSEHNHRYITQTLCKASSSLHTNVSVEGKREKEEGQVDAIPSTINGVPYDGSPLEINLDLAMYKVKVLSNKNRVFEAVELLKKCIKYWPEKGRPYVALGRLLTKQGKFAEARFVYENGCQATEGDNSYIWQAWATLEQKMGKIKKARKLYDAAIAANKKHAAAWHAWACLEINAGNIKKARVLLENGLKNSGPNPYIFHTFALLEIRARRYQQARSFLLEAVKSNPKSCASWLTWAQLEAGQGNNTAAERLFERAVQASPKNRFAWQMWAIFAARQGESDEARKYFRVGITLNPRDPVILQSFAIFEYHSSSALVARKIFNQASEVDPNHQPIWNAWALMEWKEGNVNTARKLYQRCLSINSSSSDASLSLQQWGRLEHEEGNIETARRLFKCSMSIDPQNYSPWSLLAVLEESQGNKERAEEIRTQYFQQKTEVVGSEFNITDVFAPAIGHIKNLLNFDFFSNMKVETQETYSEEKLLDDLDLAISNASSKNEPFEVDQFLREKLALNISKLNADGCFYKKPFLKYKQ